MTRGSPADRPESAWVVRWRPALRAATLVVVLGYAGATAPELERLRRGIRQAGGQLLVVRNRDAHQLLAGTAREGLREEIHGSTALVIAERDTAQVIERLLSIVGGGAHGIGREHLCARAFWVHGQRMNDQQAQAWASAPRLPSHAPTPQPKAGAVTLSSQSIEAMRARLRPLLEGPPLPAEEPTEHPGVTVIGHGPNKREVIGVVRTFTGRSIREGLRFVNELPGRLGEGMLWEQGEALVDALKSAGANLDLSATASGTPQGWSDWTIDEARVFAEVPHVHLRSGWTLTARVYRESAGGNGVVRAWSPQGIEGSFAEAIGGDGELISYLYASILIREIREFGAQWHGVDWGTHALIDRPSEHEWTWVELAQADEPSAPHAPLGQERSWLPRVELDDTGHVTVSFFTESSLGSVRLVGHVDRYEVGTLRPRTMERFCCATAPGGYVF